MVSSVQMSLKGLLSPKLMPDEIIFEQVNQENTTGNRKSKSRSSQGNKHKKKKEARQLSGEKTQAKKQSQETKVKKSVHEYAPMTCRHPKGKEKRKTVESLPERGSSQGRKKWEVRGLQSSSIEAKRQIVLCSSQSSQPSQSKD